MNEKAHPGDGKGDRQDPKFQVIDKRSSFTDDASAPLATRYPTFVEELKTRAEQAEARAREISAAYRQIEEERDAFRERLSRDLERRLDIARTEMMRNVLGVLDDLDRALAAARDAGDQSPLTQGVTLIREHLLRVMASEGVEAIETAGTHFDPTLAEAVAIEQTDDTDRDNLVVEELQKGYSLRGTLLRPARVRVAQCRPQEVTPDLDESPTPSERE
jgi:molecular chaperone GrpE